MVIALCYLAAAIAAFSFFQIHATFGATVINVNLADPFAASRFLGFSWSGVAANCSGACRMFRQRHWFARSS